MTRAARALVRELAFVIGDVGGILIDWIQRRDYTAEEARMREDYRQRMETK